MAKLEIRHLSISFRTGAGAVQAVRDISFSLEEGETLAVAGESGSGKSVTSRAIMGILAGNAMVEDGEILYDGKDLLKIPEEDFHTLRGHRLAMVFQDPLSALNPIMRIGKQLIEAMVLNNKERRADGKKRFSEVMENLEKEMAAAKKEGFLKEKTSFHSDLEAFKKVAREGALLENAYNAARESAIGILDCIEESDLLMQGREAKKTCEVARRMEKLVPMAENDYLLPGERESFRKAAGKVCTLGKHYKNPAEASYREALEELKAIVDLAIRRPRPDFFSIAYRAGKGEAFQPGQNLDSYESAAQKDFEESFLKGFLKEIEAAVEYERKKARGERQQAAKTLGEILPTFEKKPQSQAEWKRALNRGSAAVKTCIEPLRIHKDPSEHVFALSLASSIERYFEGVKENPREEKCFAREEAKYEAQVKKGKVAIPPVPVHLVDLEKVQSRMCASIRDLKERYENGSMDGEETGEERAKQILDYLFHCSEDACYTLSPAMAKHRAIELMKEVGIPEPHVRFTQYPFELSGGMRQRIVIAIALSANPDILICDEPTTALDVTIQAQILELIGKLKKERSLSVIFITHDLGVVANIADRVAVMYAGKIVEIGTAEEVFYDPRHPYTWALLSSMPDLETSEKLEAIPGTPPNMISPPKGDAFAPRNRYAMAIDFEEEPPFFTISPTHAAATWLLHPSAPHQEPPAIVKARIARMRREEKERKGSTAEETTTAAGTTDTAEEGGMPE